MKSIAWRNNGENQRGNGERRKRSWRIMKISMAWQRNENANNGIESENGGESKREMAK